MDNTLTSKQKKVLATIQDLTRKNGFPPTLEQLRETLQYPRISSVQRHTDALKKKGYLDQSRGLALPESAEKIQIPLVGNVACGLPLLATENIEAYISYDASGIRGRVDEYFFLRAVGDSMNNTSINGRTIDDGDYVLCKKQSTADEGSRVVALIGDEATVKRVRWKEDCVALEPESTNPSNKPIYIFDDILIQGIVWDVLKKGGTRDA